MLTQIGSTKKKRLRLILILTALALLIGNATAQTTQFTYQGKLGETGNPANGNYDFEFKLFDTAIVGTGAQQGSTLTVPSVQVNAGIFTVQLDFGAAAFPGTARFLEIAVKPEGGATLTVLSPRQPVNSTPYAVRSATAASADTANNATQLGGLGASGFIQNTTTQQAATSFNIGGTGTANILNAQTQFNLNGNRILSRAGTNNLFVGVNTGLSNTTGQQNAFFGESAGLANTTGGNNAFFGSGAGLSNATGGGNSFFGTNAGFFNTTGQLNAFFGSGAGQDNTTGSQNSFFGGGAGELNTTGGNNAFFGFATGFANTTGVDNAFFGTDAGGNNNTGGFNSFFGRGSGRNNTNGSGNAFFGTSAGFHNTTGQLNAFFGEGAGSENITGTGNTFIGRDADFDVVNPTGSNNTLLGFNARVVSGVSNSTAIGAGAIVGTSNTIVLGRSTDAVQIPGLFSLSGTVGASIFNATTQFNLSGSRILSAGGTGNLIAGIGAGAVVSTGTFNSFFGHQAGLNHTTGCCNAFFGSSAGQSNTTGGDNAFFGDFAGVNNTTGSDNTFIGKNAGPPNPATQVNNSVAIGSGVTVSTSNTIVLGTTVHTTRIPGKVIMGAGPLESGGVAQTFDTGNFQGIFAANLVLFTLNDILPSPVHVCTRSQSLGGGFGGEALTRCTSSFSSVKDKTDVQPFSTGLDLINRLKPVTFKWKDGGGSDFGLNAEDVAEVEPLLVTRNDKGEVEDVKERSLNVLFINAIKEQQAQIKQQQQEIETLKKRQQEIDALKALLCTDHPTATVCKSN